MEMENKVSEAKAELDEVSIFGITKLLEIPEALGSMNETIGCNIFGNGFCTQCFSCASGETADKESDRG